MASDFIPNSYQTPNAYVDRFMAYLTPEEWVVLSYFTRRILGFQKRQDNIASSQLTDGIVAKDGTRLDYGTGLGAAAVKNAVKNLKAFNLITEIEPNNPHQNKGPLYTLQLNSELVNFSIMQQRKTEKEAKQNARMSKARKAILSDRPPSNEQTPLYSLDIPPLYPIDPPPPLSNRVHNNQGNTDRKPDTTQQGENRNFIDAVEAERIYTKVTGFMSLPSGSREEATRLICDIARVKGSETADYLRPFYTAYIDPRRRTRNGTPYMKSGTGWLDWAATGEVPPIVDSKQERTGNNNPPPPTRTAEQDAADLAVINAKLERDRKKLEAKRANATQG